MQKITPNLWFSRNAQKAVEFYTSIFPESKIIGTAYYPENSEEGLADFQKEFAGKVLSIDFELHGQRFTAINAGDEFKFSEAVSFAIVCKDQEELDFYWNALSAVSEAEQCGWCKDKYGLSWQVVPENMEALMNKPNAFATLMQQKKIVIAEY